MECLQLCRKSQQAEKIWQNGTKLTWFNIDQLSAPGDRLPSIRQLSWFRLVFCIRSAHRSIFINKSLTFWHSQTHFASFRNWLLLLLFFPSFLHKTAIFNDCRLSFPRVDFLSGGFRIDIIKSFVFQMRNRKMSFPFERRRNRRERWGFFRNVEPLSTYAPRLPQYDFNRIFIFREPIIRSGRL